MKEVTEGVVDFLTIIPELEVRANWERVIQPACAFVLMVWFQPDRVNNPKKATAYANGAFMLLHRKCYGAIGGHEEVRCELNEDIRMARLAAATHAPRKAAIQVVQVISPRTRLRCTSTVSY